VRERLTFIFPICKSIEKRIFILENIIVLWTVKSIAKVILETRIVHKLDINICITMTGSIPLFVFHYLICCNPPGIIYPVYSALALTWFIIYMNYCNVCFLNNVIKRMYSQICTWGHLY
jgi:hypothetical protein